MTEKEKAAMTTLQLNPISFELRNEFKAAAAASKFKTMPEFFEHIFREYLKNN